VHKFKTNTQDIKMTNFILELLKSPRPFLLDVVRVHRRRYFILPEVMNKQTKDEIEKLSRGTNSIHSTLSKEHLLRCICICAHQKYIRKLQLTTRKRIYLPLRTVHKYTYRYLYYYLYIYIYIYI